MNERYKVIKGSESAHCCFDATTGNCSTMFAMQVHGLTTTQLERSPTMTTVKHPIQPLVTDSRGVLRFKENQIVSDLLDFASNHGFGLNEIACRDYSREDRQQLAQLIGYSLRGYGDLNYVDDDAYGAAQLMAGGLDEMEALTEHLQSTLNALRAALVKPMAELFGVHPDDLSTNLPETNHENQ